MTQLYAVPFTQVEIADAFWSPRRAANRLLSLPLSLDKLAEAGNLHNLELAASGATTGFTGPVFADSDIYKALEAVAFSLATDPDPALNQRIDAIIALIAAAQRPDGYLNTAYQVKIGLDKRWTNLRDNHELYCAGHLFEAAVAHFQATGQRTLLDVAVRFADHIDSIFGDGPGKRPGYPGHPEIELALIKLWRVTGERRYFDLARFFVVHRGSHFFAEEHGTPLDDYHGEYWQDHRPIREHNSVVGHAVRAAYLYSGVVDVAAETGDDGLLAMVNRVWKNTVNRRMYVTGGIGSSGQNEGFTTDYDLPNLTAYQETCASVAMMMWNQRLNLVHKDTRYADMVELALYNGFLAGVSLDASRYFYDNPLASLGHHHRSEWFGCACCPPNVTRTLASLGGYAYAASYSGLWVNLYIQGSVQAEVNGDAVAIDVTTDYPWDGNMTLKINSGARFALHLRIPGWCSGATVQVNGAPANTAFENGYIVLDRDWTFGDVVRLDLPMPVRRLAANPLVQEDRACLALARGPLIYCLEDADQSAPVSTLALSASAVLTAERAPDLLGGIVVLKAQGEASAETDWPGGLYQTAQPPTPVPVTAIPYYAWDNRAPGGMKVWIPTAPPPPLAGDLERRAEVSVSFQSPHSQPGGINDGVIPANSVEQPAALCHWWPHKGTEEWAQYTWKTPQAIDRVEVYWFADPGRGECRFPAAWHIEYLDGAAWKPVNAKTGYLVQGDQWCAAEFAPVTTTALRLVIQAQPGWSLGVHEWKVQGLKEEAGD